MGEKRGRGRPRLPDDERRRIYGISLAPATIELLRDLAAKAARSQGEFVDSLIEREAKRRGLGLSAAKNRSQNRTS